MADSRNEAILENILGSTNELLEPMSNNEKILLNILGETGVEIDPPQSRIENLLLQVLEQGTGGYDAPDTYLTGTLTVTNNTPYGVMIAGLPSYRDGTGFVCTEQSCPPGETILKKLYSNYSYIAVAYTAAQPYAFSDLSGAVLLNDGNPIKVTSSASTYVFRLSGRNSSFTVSNA